MFRSIRDLAPYLEAPWRSRIEVADGWPGPPGLPYAYPQISGVAKADAVTSDGSPAGSEYELVREQLLDEYGIERAVLTGGFYPTEMQVQPEFATALAAAYNDWMMENWLECDERFLGSVCIAAQDPRAAAREIDRVGAHPRMVQVVLPTIPHDTLGKPFYGEIFEAAVRNGLAVAFHQGNASATAVGLPTYYIEWHTAVAQSWQSQLIGLIAHGVFDRHPDLRVLMIESSWTWVPSLMWRFDYNYRSLRREVPWVKRMPSEYIRDNVRFTTQPMEYPDDPEHLYRMFEMIGSEEFLLFSTDYPHWDFDSPSQVFPKSFPKDLREKILSSNARKFYDL
ncbi:MAG: amidohydrolase [Rubrobacter sp.]|nr:amidohydrolase [Rubrobacter sp.]